MRHLFFFAAAVCLALGGTSGNCLAQSAKASAKSTDALTVVKSSVRRVPSTAGHADVETSFEIVWNSSTPPQAIYYRRGKSQWLKCKPSRPEKRPFGGGPNDFMVVYMSIPFAGFRQGEQLTLTAERHTDDALPAAVRNMPPDALYYQLANSPKWHAKKVNVAKLPPVKK